MPRLASSVEVAKDEMTDISAVDAPPQNAKRTRKLSYSVLFATISAASMAYVGSTALNVSLPAIQIELNARGADLLWISNSYIIVQASLLVVFGSLSDRFGHNRICMLGILLYGIASLIAGTAPTVAVLILARFAQGVGSAMIVPCTLAIVSAHFSGDRHGWGIGIWSAFTLFSSGLGPFIGGVLTEMGMWRMIFYVQIPFGVAAAWVLWRTVPETYSKESEPIMGWLSALLITLSLLGLTHGFLEAPQVGFGHSSIRLSLAFGIASLLLFVLLETHEHARELLALFRVRTFTGGNLALFLLYVSVGPILIYIPLNMIQIQGYSESFVGIAILPMTIFMLISSAYIGGIVDRYGPRTPIVGGHALTFLAFVLLAMVGITGGQHDYWKTFFLPLCLAGMGLGITLAPLTVAVLESVEESKAGIASGISNTLSRVGQVLSVAVMGGFVLSIFTSALLNDPKVRALPEAAQNQLEIASVDLGETTIPEALSPAEKANIEAAIRASHVAAYNVLLWVSAAFCLLSGILSWMMISNRLVRRQERVP